jgi:uncharacterized protein YecT (DUF1311 family)
MKYFATVFLLVFAGSLPGRAQESSAYKTCSNRAKTQTQMNACAAAELERSDAELNTVYRKLLAKAADRNDSGEKIKAAERAWITYRDAYMDAMYPAADKQAQYGSIYPMQAALVRSKLTQRQIAALKELLRQYTAK